MQHQITLNESDYVTFQLYEASTNPLKVKNRNRSYLLQIIFAISLVIIGVFSNNDFILYMALAITVLEVFLGKAYIKWMHKRHYIKHTRNTHKNSFGEAVEIEILDDVINVADRAGESRTKISEIVSVCEIQSHYFIKIITGPSLLISKENSLLNQEINEMIKAHKILHTIQLEW